MLFYEAQIEPGVNGEYPWGRHRMFQKVSVFSGAFCLFGECRREILDFYFGRMDSYPIGEDMKNIPKIFPNDRE